VPQVRILPRAQRKIHVVDGFLRILGSA